MKRNSLLIGALIVSGCVHPPPPAPPSPVVDEDLAATLTVDNTTPSEVGVYFIDGPMHVRLGTAPPTAKTKLAVRKSTIGNRMSFRVYAFRGQEPCPVARVIDLSFSRTPNMIVAATDTVVTGYFPSDACLKKSNR